MSTAEVPTLVAVKLSMGRVHACTVDDRLGEGAPRPGACVVVQSEGGPTLGTVVREPAAVVARRAADPGAAPRVLRLATPEDVATRRGHRQREQDAYRVAQLKVRERGLPMKVTRVEQALDGSRLLCYFTADSRVDFRELVRDLAAEFRVRVEMRQIGVRDAARMLGGFGSCGRPLCCATFLTSFEPVSIRMAKEQALSLNPSKLSGLCGRLKCCLRYELPNGKGELHGGCGSEGGCRRASGCGTGACDGACASCRSGSVS